jgi:hypothetical protein
MLKRVKRKEARESRGWRMWEKFLNEEENHFPLEVEGQTIQGWGEESVTCQSFGAVGAQPPYLRQPGGW